MESRSGRCAWLPVKQLVFAAVFLGTLLAASCAYNPFTPVVHLSSGNFTIDSDLPSPFPETILQDCETILDGYKELFGIDLHPSSRILLSAFYDVMQPTSLWIRPDLSPVEIHLVVSSDAHLNAPGEGGYHNVCGFAHEFGHLAMMFDDPVFGQGFANYLGSQIVDYMQKKLGNAAWPRPYDYSTVEGTGRLRTWEDNPKPEYDENGIAAGLAKIAARYGADTIPRAVAAVIAAGDSVQAATSFSTTAKAYKVSALLQSLVELTGDSSVSSMLQRETMESWKQNVLSSEIWAAGSHANIDDLLNARWGGNGSGFLDGVYTELVQQRAPGIRTGEAFATPSGIELQFLSWDWAQVFYQKRTMRTCLVGTFRVVSSGAVLENCVIDSLGRPVSLP